MSATLTRLDREHRLRTQSWLKDPNRRPYRISITASGTRIARCGELVLGAFATNAEAQAAIEVHIRTPWQRAS